MAFAPSGTTESFAALAGSAHTPADTAERQRRLPRTAGRRIIFLLVEFTSVYYDLSLTYRLSLILALRDTNIDDDEVANSSISHAKK